MSRIDLLRYALNDVAGGFPASFAFSIASAAGMGFFLSVGDFKLARTDLSLF